MRSLYFLYTSWYYIKNKTKPKLIHQDACYREDEHQRFVFKQDEGAKMLSHSVGSNSL